MTSRPPSSPTTVQRSGGLAGERGAILVQTAAMLIGLTALSAFIVDYGILWTSRRQVQNAADAAALAAAVSLGFDAPNDLARARANGAVADPETLVWGGPANVPAGDVTLVPCPTGAVGRGPCVKVDVFRTADRGGALPTIFGRLVGVTEQSVQATATGQVLYGNATDCVKPLAIPDRWLEQRNNQGPPGWDPLDTFERYAPNGRLLGGPVDGYERPVGIGTNGSGYSRERNAVTAGDYGLQLRFMATPSPTTDRAGGERFVPVRMAGSGADDFQAALQSCTSRVVTAGTTLTAENAAVSVETAAAVTALLDRDPAAHWDGTLNGGRGGVAGGCMASGECTIAAADGSSQATTVSPRIVALPVFDPDQWDQRFRRVVVRRVVGFFLERYDAPFVVGRLMVYPAAPRTSMTADPSAAFVIGVALVR